MHHESYYPNWHRLSQEHLPIMRPQLHPVPIKTLEQHDYQLLLRIRTRHKQQRTGTVNQVRGILTE
ncbi:MAG: hypothetical protein GKR96_14820 [Gammaproteobacteria bacterium]|nr:hypothetical protein [Gammaproteobacteria bacterium]